MSAQDQYIDKLEKAAKLTREEAKAELLAEVTKLAADDLAKSLEIARQDFISRSSELAQEIIVDAMLHGATEYTAEYSVSTITLPNEGIKGGIIGQGGRNIAAWFLSRHH